ncbi:hypothetical protein E3N88_15105 [Mikania micrantha]|uniref:PB1 domain-containing protein n=1 Tax=Mikania micrantha TaxID=192012 RepID=A0A5N6NXP0_9ASTR|nr:hypothetical protein E3N88_15105 [Mikania micrantha]
MLGNQLNTIQDKIKSVFSDIADPDEFCIGQFWAPVTINDRRLLSTSGQPFVINKLTMVSAMYRLHSEEYEYDIDVYKDEIEGDPRIRSGGPASAFLNRLLCTSPLLESERCFGWKYRIMIPICYPSDQSDCIGVIEITLKDASYVTGYFVLDALKKKVDLDIHKVRHHIPYETINGLKHASEIVCKSHNLGLAQVWVSFEDKTHVRLSSCLEDTRKILGLNLTGYLYNVFPKDFYLLEWYYTLCQVFPLESTSEEHVLVAFQDFKPRYIYAIHDDEFLFQWEELDRSCCAFTICLKSLETGNFTFLFQFIWPSPPEDSRCDVLLEAILLTIKRCLPSFKFASGAKIGDELDVIDVGCPKEDQNTSFKLFQGKQTTVVDNISPSKETYQTTSKVLPPDHIENQLLDDIFVTNPTQKPKANHKTAKKNLTREVIEKQFGKTMKEAAHHLKDLPIKWKDLYNDYCAFAICLRSLETGDFNFVFQFLWPNHSRYSRCDFLLEAILLTINRCLPTFKFASGSKIAGEIDVIDVECSNEDGDAIFKIFQGKQSIVVDNIAPSKETYPTTSKLLPPENMENPLSDVICVINPTQKPNVNNKTAKIFLTREVIEKQFGKTMNEAAHNLKATFVTVEKRIGAKFELSVGTFMLKYLDEDEDWILLTSDEEMNDCIHSSRKSDRIVVRLNVLPSLEKVSYPSG